MSAFIKNIKYPKRVLFDWDGTLAVAAKLYTRALEIYLNEMGLALSEKTMRVIDEYTGIDRSKQIPTARRGDKFNHIIWEEICKTFSKADRKKIPADVDDMTTMFHDGILDRIIQRREFDIQDIYVAMEGSLELIRKLAEKKIPMGIVTDAKRVILQSGITSFGLNDVFTAENTITSSDYPDHVRKPNPEPILSLLRKLGIEPSDEIHYIGDLVRRDLMCGINAGVATFIFCTRESDKEEVESQGGHAITGLRSYDTLLSTIKAPGK